MDRLRHTLFRRFAINDTPKAGELLNRCKETIQKVSEQHSSSKAQDDTTEHYQMNWHQCNFLVGRLETDTECRLREIQLSPLLDEKTIPALEELHQVLLDVEKVIIASRITSSQWPRSALEQSDMKETFARLLYGVQWHVSVVLSILVDNSRESSITFGPASCEGELSVGDELSLLTAMKEDEESLKDRLRSVKLDDETQKRLANELLNLKMRSEEEDRLLKTPSAAGDSTGLGLSPHTLLELSPDDLQLGESLGRGASAEVKRTNLIGGEYATKILNSVTLFEQELDVLQRLGRHPHIVRLLGYSKNEETSYLIMEKMDKDLATALSDILRNRRRNQATQAKRPLSDVQAVALMLQIGEGVKYIHNKGMAHRDLKPGNVLVNLDSSGRISSVKVADFGLTKTKNDTQTMTYERGTNAFMAPEVIRGDDPQPKSRFNPKRADVYAFAITCVQILTGKYPYTGIDPIGRHAKERVKAGTLRPDLPEDCPPKLAALIKRCWHPISQERPLFPDICKELRYIKGLLLRVDRATLELQDIRPLRPLGRAQMEGPWGGPDGGSFRDVGTSINRVKFRYSQSPGLVVLLEVEYGLAGSNSVKKYCFGRRGHVLYEDIVFAEFEFITRISGCVSKRVVSKGTHREAFLDVVVSLTIYTNHKCYGPYGDEEGEPFESSIGRVIGFHGRCGTLLDSLGVEILLSDTS